MIRGTFLVFDSISEAVATGRFRSQDLYNRKKYRLTSALLDHFAFPYSIRLRNWHTHALLITLQQGVPLGVEDSLLPQ